jgi:hypothetical protein
MKRLLLASVAACWCLLTAQTANAKGCLEGAALGGAVGNMTHHTFLGIFGGCAGGYTTSTQNGIESIQTAILINSPMIITAGCLRAGTNV